MSELYELPEGWEWKKLDEFTKIKSGKRVPKGYKLSEEFTPYPYIRVTDFNNYRSVDTDNIRYISEEIYQKIKNYTITDNDIYISVAGTIGKTGIVPSELNGANLTENAVKIIFDNDKYDKKYLLYFTDSIVFMKQVGLATKVVAMPKLAITRLKKVLIPLLPLQGQKRIVAKLDALFAKIDKAIALHQKNMDEADAFMGSVLNDVFGELEEKYEVKTLNDIFFIQRGCSPRPIKEYITSDEDGINWIKISDATKGDGKYIDLTAQKIKPSGLKKSRLVVKGDFIMSNSMSFGKPYIIKTKGAIHDGWLLLREKVEKVDKNYFYHLLSSNYMYKQFASKASGTTVKNLNIDLVKSSNIIFPPLPIQQKTVTYLDSISQKIENLKQVQKEKMQSLVALKASILDQAFRGKLQAYAS